MKNKGLMALVLTTVLSFTALAPTTFAAESTTGTAAESTAQETQKGHWHGKKESVEAPENAIGKDAAKEKALADAGVTADQAGKVKSHLSKLEDGTIVYKVHFTYNGQRYSYKINATSGEVTDKSTKAVTEDKANKPDKASKSGRHGKGKKDKTTSSETSSETGSTTAAS